MDCKCQCAKGHLHGIVSKAGTGSGQPAHTHLCVKHNSKPTDL